MTQAGAVTQLSAGAFGSANTLGNFIVVWISGSFSGNITSVTDNARTPNTYTQLYLAANGAVKCAAYLAKITSLPASGNLNPQANFSSSTNAVDISASEFSGGSLNLDGSAITHTGTSASTYAGGPITTNQANDLLITGFTQDDNTQTITVPTGFTSAGVNPGSGTREPGGGAYQILLGGVSNQNVNWTSSGGSSQPYATGVVALQPAPAGGHMLRGIGA
jgi:hypothetical protein